MKKIKLGIIGLGLFFRKTHLPVLSAKKSGFSVTGIYSSDVRKFRSIKRSFPLAKYYSHSDALLSDPSIDAVVACVPIPQQYRTACQVIKAYKPLLLEKPMAANLWQAAAIKDLAKRKGVPVMVAESFRYFRHFRDLKNMLDRRVLGKVKFIQVQAIKKFDKENPYHASGWRVPPQGYPGILWDAGIHAVSLISFLFGKFKVKYRALRSYDRSLGRHDTVLAHLIFSEKREGSFLMSYALPGREEYFLTIFCDRGRIKCGMNSLVVESAGRIREHKYQEHVYPEIYDDFYRLVRNKRKPLYTLDDAYADLKGLDQLVN